MVWRNLLKLLIKEVSLCNNITSKQFNVALLLVVMMDRFNPRNNTGECNSFVCINVFLFRPISRSMHICANIVT